MGLFKGDLDRVTRQEIEERMRLPEKDVEKYDVTEELESTAFRDELDADLCDKLFKDLRKMESNYDWRPDRKMYTVMLAVVIMESGAKISDDNMQHLRHIAPRILGSEFLSSNEGFCDPGKAQFLAALEHYKPGTPRDFSETSCYQCGKIKADTGKELSSCGSCMNASYCDQDCQMAHWRTHKHYCVAQFPKPSEV